MGYSWPMLPHSLTRFLTLSSVLCTMYSIFLLWLPWYSLYIFSYVPVFRISSANKPASHINQFRPQTETCPSYSTALLYSTKHSHKVESRKSLHPSDSTVSYLSIPSSWGRAYAGTSLHSNQMRWSCLHYTSHTHWRSTFYYTTSVLWPALIEC